MSDQVGSETNVTHHCGQVIWFLVYWYMCLTDLSSGLKTEQQPSLCYKNIVVWRFRSDEIATMNHCFRRTFRKKALSDLQFAPFVTVDHTEQQQNMQPYLSYGSLDSLREEVNGGRLKVSLMPFYISRESSKGTDTFSPQWLPLMVVKNNDLQSSLHFLKKSHVK